MRRGVFWVGMRRFRGLFWLFFGLFISLSLFLNCSYVSAATCGSVETSLIECDEGGTGGINHVLLLVLDIMSIGVGIVGVIGISWAGIQYLTAKGDEGQAKKAKRRIYEIVIGIACYVVVFGVMRWLLPSVSTPGVDSSNVSSLSMKSSYEGNVGGDALKPKVEFNEGATNTTYSLHSSDPSILTVLGSNAKCLDSGTVTLTAIASNGTKTTSTAKCTDNGNYDNSSTGIGQAKDGIASDGSIAASDGSATVGSQLTTKLKGKPHWRAATRKIIQAHNMDFNWRNFSKVMKKYGGYVKYVQSLKNSDGSDSVFSAYASRVNKNGNIARIPVTTAADFQAAAEYVFGLWAIWGVDYSNGSYDHHPYWGDPSDAHQSLDRTAFHYLEPGREYQTSYCRSCNVNTHLRGPEIVGIGCDIAIDMLAHTLKLPSFGSTTSATKMREMSKQNYPKNNGSITKWKDVRVGDILYFRKSEGGAHVAIAGEVYSDYVVVYDGGSYFQYHKFFKYTVPRRNTGSLHGTPWDCCGYTYLEALRPWKIDQSITLKGLN